MNLDDHDFIASEYAKARVEEIKKKVSSSKVSKENNCVKTHKPTTQEYKEYIPSKTIQSEETKQPLSIKNAEQYQNRIKNIDDINSRIKNILTIKTRPSSSNKPIKSQASHLQHKKSSIKKQSLADLSTYTVSVEYRQGEKWKKIMDPKYKQNNQKKIKINTKQNTSNKKKENIQNVNNYEKKEYSPIKNIRNISCSSSKINSPLKSNVALPTSTFTLTNHKKEENQKGSTTMNKQTIKLAEILSQQIILDQKFRQAKWVFSEWSHPEKWNILTTKYENRYPGSSQQEVKSVFQICSDEHNPFFETPNTIDQTCIDLLLSSYKQALDFWQRKVDECSSIDKLEKQFFIVTDLDLNKKGYLSVEDLVCFVNLFTGNFFRNRDVVSLYRRFTQMGELKYENFLQKVTK